MKILIAIRYPFGTRGGAGTLTCWPEESSSPGDSVANSEREQEQGWKIPRETLINHKNKIKLES